MPKTESDPRCNLCNAPLLWAKTVAGNNFALNREPDPAGNFVVINGGSVLAEAAPEWDGPRYSVHRPTCAKRIKAKEADLGDPTA